MVAPVAAITDPDDRTALFARPAISPTMARAAPVRAALFSDRLLITMVLPLLKSRRGQATGCRHDRPEPLSRIIQSVEVFVALGRGHAVEDRRGQPSLTDPADHPHGRIARTVMAGHLPRVVGTVVVDDDLVGLAAEGAAQMVDESAP